MAQAPMAITYLGSAIWSYNLFSTGPILFTIVPAMIITSACRGEALATSNPNLEKSYLAEATAIISIPQQLVAKVRGHNELDRAQLITSSSLLNTMPPPGPSCISPGKAALFPGDGVKEVSRSFELAFIISALLVSILCMSQIICYYSK